MKSKSNPQFARTSHGRRTWMEILIGRHLCCSCSEWTLRISRSARNNLVSFDWLRTGAEHLLILTYLLTYLLIYFLTYLLLKHRHDSTVSTCFKEAVDTNTVQGLLCLSNRLRLSRFWSKLTGLRHGHIILVAYDWDKGERSNTLS